MVEIVHNPYVDFEPQFRTSANFHVILPKRLQESEPENPVAGSRMTQHPSMMGKVVS